MTRKVTKRRPPHTGQVATSRQQISLESVREFAQLFKFLSDTTRLRLLFSLAISPNRALHVGELCARLGQTRPTVSHHLALLKGAGLVESRRKGRHSYYSVCTDQFGELLLRILSVAGEVPKDKEFRFHDFVLSYSRDRSGPDGDVSPSAPPERAAPPPVRIAESYPGVVEDVSGDRVVVVYEVDGKIVEQTYEKTQFTDGRLPTVDARLVAHVSVVEAEPSPVESQAGTDESQGEPFVSRRKLLNGPTAF
jgi:DNA-binding transcriptional ArsR family regulator